MLSALPFAPVDAIYAYICLPIERSCARISDFTINCAHISALRVYIHMCIYIYMRVYTHIHIYLCVNMSILRFIYIYISFFGGLLSVHLSIYLLLLRVSVRHDCIRAHKVGSRGNYTICEHASTCTLMYTRATPSLTFVGNSSQASCLSRNSAMDESIGDS